MEFPKNDESVDSNRNRFNQDIYSKVIRAGKRTYFFDVKNTRKDEYYLTITESKRRFEDSGQPVFEKHKIFLYREDFVKFMEGLKEIIDFIDGKQPMENNKSEINDVNDSADFEFEDLSSLNT